VHFSGPHKTRVDHHVVFPLAPDALEGEPCELAHRVRRPAGDDEVLRSVELQHLPHGGDVLAGESPIAPCIQIAERQLVGKS
jgi:hypothetical protein